MILACCPSTSVWTGKKCRACARGRRTSGASTRMQSLKTLKPPRLLWEWVITSDEGRDALANQMGFVTPFPPLTPAIPRTTRCWTPPARPGCGSYARELDLPTMPSEAWKTGVGAALLEYAQGTKNGPRWKPRLWTAGPASTRRPEIKAPFTTPFTYGREFADGEGSCKVLAGISAATAAAFASVF